MFEAVDMCSALSILPIVDFNLGETSADMADLVDFLHGDASTEWGAKRIATGHLEPYNLTFFEFGNEQGIDAAVQDFGRIVTAMETRRASRPSMRNLNFSYVIGACKGQSVCQSVCLSVSRTL